MKPYLLIIISLFFLVSCEDFFETTIELEQPELEPNFTFNVYVSNEEDQLATAHVSRLIGIDQVFDFDEVLLNDAKISITNLESGAVFDFATSDDPNPAYAYVLEKPDGFPQALVEYELTIEHPDYPVAKARQVMPEKVNIDEINFFEDAGLNEEGEESAGVELIFTDTPGLNFYEISVNRMLNGLVGSALAISSTDPSSHQADYRSVLLEDVLFENEQKSVLIKFDRYLAEEKLAVSFRKINEAQYRHIRTKNQASDTGDNPFQTPVQIFSNGDNGFGLFAMYSKHNEAIN